MPRIMIVEDDFSTTMNLEEMLTALGYEVVGKAERASKAIDMARELKPDLILMDIVMPGDMDGITAAEKIKEEWGIPIVFLTAYGNPEYIQRAKRVEPFGYIVKPFDESEIQAVVEIALYKHEVDKKLKKSHTESAEFNRNLKKEIEEREKSEEKYRDLVENINDVIYALDITGTVTYVSPTIEAISGYSPSEIIGKHMTGFVHRDDHASLAERFRELIMEGHIQAFEYRMIDKQGKIRWIRSSSRLIFQDGKLSGVQGAFTEITHSKKLEEQLRHAQKMEAISTLTGGIAHDYNNLLTIILGNLSMARDLTKPNSFMAELLDQVEQASSKAGDLTHRLMTLSTGGHPMKKGGSVRSLIEEITRQVKLPDGIKYVFSIQDDLWLVEYDSKQMHYAISNVLINAMEAMPQGGKITIKAENKVIDDRDKESWVPLNKGKYVEISISDQGKGIPEKNLNRIYDPYFSTKERGVQKGMGLGLTTAYAVVEKHGGHILVNSSIGAGTTATIYLPAVENEIPSVQRDHVETQTSIDKQQSEIRRVLVMDDEESLRNLAREMLERLGCKVETVKDGVDAILTYKSHLNSGEPFDLVILDLTIKGGMGGDQTMKELIKIDSGVKGIVCSGYFNDPVMANYEEHGFRGAMAKPYQKKDLECLLNEVL